MASWKRNLYVLTAAETVAVSGFFLIIPFLPYYVQDLGITDPDQVKTWSGWLFSSQALALALIAPIWGSLADRFGRKIMVQRAMFGGAVLFVLMGCAQTVQQLLVLRVLQGLLTGTVTAAITLVAAISPRSHSGSSQGLLQMGIYTGTSVGPLLGGVLADAVGYRASFWVTSGALFLAAIAVNRLVEESFVPSETNLKMDSRFWRGISGVLHSPPLRSVIFVQFMTRMGFRVFGPLLPLFIQELSSDDRRATVVGSVLGLSSLATAAGMLVFGRLSDRIGHRRTLLMSSFAVALCFVPQSLVSNAIQLSLLQVAAGLAMAGVLVAIAALLTTYSSDGQQGVTFGVNTSIVGGANALAPMLGASAAVWWGLRSIFLVAAGLFAVGGLLTLWLFSHPKPDGVTEPAELS
jgi:DHA1 family multidrug resistance protein-like MFS transporter